MPELGTKHECASCGTRFYDLGSAEPVCPKCGLNQLADEEPEEPAAAEDQEAAAADDGKDSEADGDGEEE